MGFQPDLADRISRDRMLISNSFRDTLITYIEVNELGGIFDKKKFLALQEVLRDSFYNIFKDILEFYRPNDIDDIETVAEVDQDLLQNIYLQVIYSLLQERSLVNFKLEDLSKEG